MLQQPRQTAHIQVEIMFQEAKGTRQYSAHQVEQGVKATQQRKMHGPLSTPTKQGLLRHRKTEQLFTGVLAHLRTRVKECTHT